MIAPKMIAPKMTNWSATKSIGPVLLLSAVMQIAGPVVHNAAAQNGSLLHAPLTGAVVDIRPRAVAQLPFPQQLQQPMPNRTVPLQSLGQPRTNPNDRPTTMLSRASWTYQPAPPTRVFRKNDIVTIRVDEVTRIATQGSARIRRRTLYEAVLADWIKLSGFSLRPDPQSDGDPTVGTESNSQFQTDSNIKSSESLAFNISATVVDIRPNGNMVLEARKKIRVNDNLFETSLTGICRAQDIAPDNVILSKDLIDLEIGKEDQGHLRDGYKRGWFQRWIDRAQPF